MSNQFRIDNSTNENASYSKRTAKMPPLQAPPTPPDVIRSPSQIQFPNLPSGIRAQGPTGRVERDAEPIRDYQLNQANAISQVNSVIRGPSTGILLPSSSTRSHRSEPHDSPSPYDGSLSTEAQLQSSSGLENQLRNMILSHEPPPGPGSTYSANAPLPVRTPQVTSSGPHGNHKRPNQAQRKQQAQQMQLPFQHQPMIPNKQNPNQSKHPHHYGQWPANGRFIAQQPSTVSPPSSSNYQRQPRGAFAQPQSLFDPNLGANMGRVGAHRLQEQVISIQAQIDYIDHLARYKIPQVEMSAEEFEQKQMLKARLNDICRKVVLDHELKTNPGFPAESVELKSFGSLSIGFATKDSDMDLVLVSPESKPGLSSSESELPRKIEEALMELRYGARLLTKTRVPIIKFCEKPTPELAAHLRLTRLEWERERNSGEIQLDQQSSAQESETHPEVAEKVEVLDQEQDHKADGDNTLNSNSPETIHSGMFESNGDPGSNLSPTTVQNGKKTSREKQRFDRAWFPRLSDYELIGLFKMSLKENRCAPHQRAIITECLECLKAQPALADPEVLQERRETLWNMVDVVENGPPPTRSDLEFPKSGVGTQCDINFSNQLALHNSLLLKCYSLCDPRVRRMVLFVKAWTKIRKINSPYHGTLNSYGYVLMVLHFLMNVAQPPVIPNLQLASDMIRQDPLSLREVSFEGHNVQFFRNEAAIEEMARNGVFGRNRESLGSLLRGFFQFYANPPFGAFSWKDDVLSLRTRGGKLTKVGKGWVGAKTETVDTAGPGTDQKRVSHRYVVAIEDPFETGHNVARTVFFNGVVAIRDEFRRAADLISTGGIDPRRGPQDFFAEGKKNENLQHRHGVPHKGVGHQKNNPSSGNAMPAIKPTVSDNTNMRNVQAAKATAVSKGHITA